MSGDGFSLSQDYQIRLQPVRYALSLAVMAQHGKAECVWLQVLLPRLAWRLAMAPHYGRPSLFPRRVRFDGLSRWKSDRLACQPRREPMTSSFAWHGRVEERDSDLCAWSSVVGRNRGCSCTLRSSPVSRPQCLLSVSVSLCNTRALSEWERGRPCEGQVPSFSPSNTQWRWLAVSAAVPRLLI